MGTPYGAVYCKGGETRPVVGDPHEYVSAVAPAPGGKAWGRLSIMCQYHCVQIMRPQMNAPNLCFQL